MNSYVIVMPNGEVITLDNIDDVRWNDQDVKMCKDERVVACFTKANIVGWYEVDGGTQHDD